MKQYLTDEIHPADYEKLKTHLDAAYDSSPMGGIYWVPMDPEKATALQKQHGACQPHVFALHLEEDRLCAEFLIRTLSTMRCDCMGYADEKQALHIIGLVDGILEDLGIVC